MISFKISSHSGKLKWPMTQAFNLLNDELVIFIRSWGGGNSTQAIVDEISQFLSSSSADLEVTTPFEYLEHISSGANKARIALLLAHDLIYKTVNKELYSEGFELALFYQKNNEIAWASVGRFNIFLKDESVQLEYPILTTGSSLDLQTLLPTQLLGLEKTVEINCGSFSQKRFNQIELKSSYLDDQTFWKSQISLVKE